ncbi:MAG: hypothetical protein HZC55_10680 [Verrucomicrobia bacterium]|nr:hypothetical protein [Verrucomicrobiota bacterium]
MLGGWLLVGAVLAGAGALCAAEGRLAEVVLELDPRSAHQAQVTSLGPGSWEVRTAGEDPYVATLPFPPAPKEASVLTFEYVSLGAVRPMEVFAVFPWSESGAVSAEELPYSEGWSTFSLDLRPALDRATRPPTRLRLDFGRSPGQVIQVRHLRLRAPDPEEEAREATRQGRRTSELALENRIRDFLGRRFSVEVTAVEVGPQEVSVQGNLGKETGELWLAESPLWRHLTEERTFARVTRLEREGEGRFSVRLPRQVAGEDASQRDRLWSRWLVVREGAGGADEVVSAARYADAVTARGAPPPPELRTKKGLGGFNLGRPALEGDLDDLGIGSVTVNLFLSRFLRSAASPRTMPFTFLGRTYHADRVEVEKLDRTLLAAARRNLLVFGIVLVPRAKSWDSPALGRLMEHPDCLPAGIYSMANVTDGAAVETYAALLDFLAERYSRPGAPFGRMHHWIIHNEVDAGWVWTNCGEKPPLLYVDQYHKSMRLAHLVLRQYDAQARVFASLTHHWAATASFRYIPSREVLRHLLAFSRAEGDFDWGIAFHPYPESLREPKTWRDRKATFAFDTPMITFKNLEVLDAWVKVPAHRYRGRDVRPVHLTEQGPNSPDYSPRALAEQAASLAYVWQKVRALDAILGFQFHNWIDNRAEGGLRIGLRRFPDDPEEPLGRKPVWQVFRALETPEEAAATAFALPLIGIQSWDEVLYRGPISGEP